MKKLLSIIIALAMMLSLAACGSSPAPEDTGSEQQNEQQGGTHQNGELTQTDKEKLVSTVLNLSAFGKDSEGNPYKWLVLDVDTENSEPVYVKQINFRLVNISDTIIRHIGLDQIQIIGYENRTEPILCQNESPGDGIPSLIITDESIDVMLIVYTQSKEWASVWDDPSGGLALTLYVTNTSISGIKFHEYINVHATDNNYVKISYGERTAGAGNQENTQ